MTGARCARVVVFDLDGTLLDSLPLVLAAIRSAGSGLDWAGSLLDRSHPRGASDGGPLFDGGLWGRFDFA